MDEIFEYLLTATSGDPAEGEAAGRDAESRSTGRAGDTARDDDVLGLLLERLGDEKVRREIVRILFPH